jgi:hypothetical protein
MSVWFSLELTASMRLHAVGDIEIGRATMVLPHLREQGTRVVLVNCCAAKSESPQISTAKQRAEGLERTPAAGREAQPGDPGRGTIAFHGNPWL